MAVRGRGWAMVVGGLLCWTAVGAEPAAAPPVIAIKAGALIDGVSGAARANQVIVIRGNRIESVGTGAIPAGARVIDLSGMTVLPGLIDSHTHVFLQGEEPAEGGYDVQLPEVPAGLPRRAGHGRGPPGAGAGLHHHPRRRDRGRGLRRRRHQAGDRRGLHPRAADVRRHPRHLHHRRLQPRGLRARARRAQGSADRRRAGGGAQGGAGAAGARRRLDQGLHDPPLLGGRGRRTGVATHAHRRGAQGDRGRGARLGQEGRMPRLQQSGCSARSTAAATPSSTASSSTTRSGADGEAGHLVLRDARPLLQATGRRRTRRTGSATASAPRCTVLRSVER